MRRSALTAALFLAPAPVLAQYPGQAVGTFTMVLFLRGNSWKVRACVERAGEG